MKNLKFFIALTLAIVSGRYSNAQLYMTSTGNVSLFTTNPAPASSLALFSYGPALFSQSTAPTSAPLIIANTAFSTATTPDYTWWNESQTGLYHPNYGSMDFTCTGVQTMALAANNVAMFDWNTSGTSSAVVSNVRYSGKPTWVVEYYNGSTYSNNFYVTGAGTVWTAGTYTGSDTALKEKFATIKNPLKKVMALTGYTYDFKEELKRNMPRQVGLVAQNVERVMPEAVATNIDGVKGVNYAGLVGLLVEAIKEQNKRIDTLQTQLNNCCNANQLPTGMNGMNNSGSLSMGGAVLYQNVPNPFTQATTIACYIPEQSNSASLMVFDMTGALKTTLPVNGKNEQKLTVSGGELAAGMYYYTLVVDGKEIDTKKMILTK